MSDYLERYGPAALVTGASSGIGHAFAEELAARGFELVVVARRVERLEALAARLRAAHGVTVTVLPADLADRDAPQQILDATAGQDVGLLVSNAGFGLKGAYESGDAGAIADMLTVNCHVPMQLAHGFVPRLRARGRGGMILTSSIEGLMGCPYSTAYSATKALVNALGEGLWAELQPAGIDVLTLCPGATESEAAGLQGIDLSRLQHVLPAAEVARATLDHIADGPTFFSSDHYKGQMDKLMALPRPDALRVMAQAMQPRE